MVEPVKVYANEIRLSGQLMVLKEDILLDRKGARCGSYLSSGREGLWCPCCGSKLRVNPRTQQTEEEEEGLQCICLTLEK
jgi:hypothetical protein